MIEESRRVKSDIKYFKRPDRKEVRKEMENLYHGWIIAKNFPYRGSHYDNVKLELFRWNTKKINYSTKEFKEVIDGYDRRKKRDAFMAEEAVKELFTMTEIEQISAFMKDNYDEDLKFRKANFPYSSNVMGFGAYPVGGGLDFYCFYAEKDYPLSFEIAGLFDMANESIILKKRKRSKTKRKSLTK